MTALGKQGVKEMARQNISKAQYAKRQFEAKGSICWTILQ